MPKTIYTTVPCIDHKGNIFSRPTQMCAHYNISFYTCLARLKRGLTLEEALTKPKYAHYVYDHKGNRYNNIEEMCQKYQTNPKRYIARIRKGMSVKDALTLPKNYPHPHKGKECEDHLGNNYRTKQEMCADYHITLTLFDKRIERGYSLEEALTKPIRKREAR